MNSQFEQQTTLLGVVGKSGAGTLDNGQKWETNRVELHCLTQFPESDSMAVGSTVAMHRLEDFNKHYENAKLLVGQKIVLIMEVVPSKKLGQPPRMACVGFKSASVAKAG